MKILLPKPVVLALAFFLLAEPLRAQSMEMNPTGVSGQFNGNVTTGGSYYPLTGNATRSIRDLVVPGSVSAPGYQLSFIRTMNSRFPADTPSFWPGDFGEAGTWRHNYGWEARSGFVPNVGQGDEPGDPDEYIVTYPDGREVRFTPCSDEGPYMFCAGPGIPDRVEGFAADLEFGAEHAWTQLCSASKMRVKKSAKNNQKNDLYNMQWWIKG